MRTEKRASWLTVSTEPADASGKERQAYPSGVVFGSGIEQVPYEAEYREEWRRAEGIPLFTLATMPMSLPELLRRWLALNQADNPFIELPARARFLYLIQALEALHSSTSREPLTRRRRPTLLISGRRHLKPYRVWAWRAA